MGLAPEFELLPASQADGETVGSMNQLVWAITVWVILGLVVLVVVSLFGS